MPRKGAQVGDEHAVIGVLGAGEVEVERVRVLHQELAAAHQAEARPHLVAELPLDVVEIERQILVRTHVGAEDRRDHFLIGRAVKHVALVAVLDAQHLLAIGLVAAAFAPQLGGLDGRHQKLDGAGAVLLLAHDLADLLQHPQAERQEGINPGRLLADHAGAQHQPVGGDLRLLRGLAQIGQEEPGKAHGISQRGRGSETGTGAEIQGQEFGQEFGEYFLPFEVGSLVTKAHRSITNVFAQSRNRHLVHEISGKRSKSWEDNTRTRNAASLPRCRRVKLQQYAELKGLDEDSRAGLLPCFFFWGEGHRRRFEPPRNCA